MGWEERARTCLRASRCCSCCCRFHWLCWMSSSMDGVPWAGATGAAGASGGWGRGGMVAAGSSSGACCLQMTGRRGGEAAPVRRRRGSRYPLGGYMGSSPPYTHPPAEDPCDLSQLCSPCFIGPGPGPFPVALSSETFGMVSTLQLTPSGLALGPLAQKPKATRFHPRLGLNKQSLPKGLS